MRGYRSCTGTLARLSSCESVCRFPAWEVRRKIRGPALTRLGEPESRPQQYTTAPDRKRTLPKAEAVKSNVRRHGPRPMETCCICDPLLKYAMQPFLRHPVPCHVPPPHPCVYPLCSRRNRFDRFAILNLHHLLHPCEDRVDETLHLLLGVFGVKYDPESALARRDNGVLHRKHAKRRGQQVEVEPPGILLLC